ncbi:MAG: hypothetical protein KTR18_03595 [Acidiferrobacterales bacterium]|nr:hypothetical protein [Acidiferrobacterales bacterium]
MSDYFGVTFKYCEFYTKSLDCCRQFPCSRPTSITFSKNHDFNLDINRDANVPCLVQYRNFYNSVVSEFELHVRVSGQGSDTKEEFHKHSIAKAKQFKLFKEKWIDAESSDNILLVPYEDLISSTEETAVRCIRYFSPDPEIDLDKLRLIISTVDGEKVEKSKILKLSNVGIHPSRDYRQFRFYDESWFAEITEILTA